MPTTRRSPASGCASSGISWRRLTPKVEPPSIGALQGSKRSRSGPRLEPTSGRTGSCSNILPRKYAAILEQRDEGKAELAELEKSIERCRIALEIQMEKAMEHSYGVLVDSFRALTTCEKCWDATSEASVDRVKALGRSPETLREQPWFPTSAPLRSCTRPAGDAFSERERRRPSSVAWDAPRFQEARTSLW